MVAMKMTYNKTEQWEYDPKMTVSDFIDANIDWISNSFVEDEPSKAYKVNDGDLEDVYDYADGNKQLYKDIMVEFYTTYLDDNDM